MSTAILQTAKNTISLPYSDYLRIKDAGNLSDDPRKEQKMREKVELNDKSKARVKNWPNTLEAKRKKKDEARFDRFKEDELERRRIDKEEFEYQTQVKKEIIEKANKQIYEQNDKVKGLKGKMLLSDALLERKGQLELDKRREDLNNFIEERHHQVLLDKVQEEEFLETQKKLEAQEKKDNVKRIVEEQHQEMKGKLIKKIQEEKIEGEIIKRKDVEANEERLKKERDTRLKCIKNNEESRKGNELQMEIKRKEKEKEKEEDKKIERFAQKKEEVLQMRKMREEFKFREKQNERQRLIDIQVKKLQELKNTENDRIDKQIIEAQIRLDEVEKAKHEKIMQLKANIDESQKVALKKKKEQVLTEKSASQNYQEFWRQKNLELHEAEQKEKNEIRERNKDLANFHKLQADEKSRKREEEFVKELEDADKVKTFLDLEEKTFNSWAERYINEYEENVKIIIEKIVNFLKGKDIKPMILQLKKYKKITLE